MYTEIMNNPGTTVQIYILSLFSRTLFLFLSRSFQLPLPTLSASLSYLSFSLYTHMYIIIHILVNPIQCKQPAPCEYIQYACGWHVTLVLGRELRSLHMVLHTLTWL